MSSLKLLLTALALIACVYNSMAEMKPLSDYYKNAYAYYSVPTLQAEMTKDAIRYQTAYDAFAPVNSSCRETANVSASACNQCVLGKCEDRYKQVCFPTVEPSCAELKENATYYCSYYVDESRCPDCAIDKDLCSACVSDRCVNRYVEVCKPTSAPTCNQLKSNSSHYCLYYANPDICSGCTNVSSESCTNCIESKCTSRGENVCGNWFTDTVLFFADDLPSFFGSVGNDIVNFGDSSINSVVNVGEGFGNGADSFFTNTVPEVGKDIDQFFTGSIPDVVSDLGDINFDFDFAPVGDIAVDVGNFALNGVLEPIGTGLTDFGNIIGDGFNIAIDGLGDFFSGGFNLGGAFGKRKRRSSKLRKLKKKTKNLRRRRSAPEPTCEEIKSDANTSCLYYQNSEICEDCGFDPDVDCVGWTTAVADLQYASDQAKWMQAQKTNDTYAITSLIYDTDKATGELSTYTDLEVELTLFGRNLKFVIAEPLNLSNGTQTGTAIGKMAADLSRIAAL